MKEMKEFRKESLWCFGILVILMSTIAHSFSEPTTGASVAGQSNGNDSNSNNGSSTTLPPVTPTPGSVAASSTTIANIANQTSTEAQTVTTTLNSDSVTSKSISSTIEGQTLSPTTPTVVQEKSSKSGSINATATAVQSTNASVTLSTNNVTASTVTVQSTAATNRATVSVSVNTKTTLSPTDTTVLITTNRTKTTTPASGSTITIPASATKAPETTTTTLTTNKMDVTEQTTVSASRKPSTVATETTSKTQTTVVQKSTVVTEPNSTVSVTAAPTSPASSVITSTVSSPEVSTTATAAPAQKILYINEVIVDKQGVFQTIEIQVKDQADLSHYVFVMVDGNTNKTMLVIPLISFNQSDGLLVVNFSSVTALSNKGIGLAIYYSSIVDGGSMFNASWVLTEQGVIDALVIGKTYDGISTKLVDILTPGVDPFVLDPSKYGKERSISRCSADSVRSTEMFALINPSLGKDNRIKCKERATYKNTLSLQIAMDCGILKLSNKTINKPLLQSLVKIVAKGINRKCHCGITRMHVLDPPQIECCKGTNLDLNFVAPNKMQDDEFLRSFKIYIKDTTEIEVNGTGYHLEKGCNGHCCTEIMPSAPKKDNSKDVKVTVAVIVTLLILFLIIVVVVYMYLRKKKIAVHQFRMSRLEEEDDYDDINVDMTMDDHDEFVGGQEATFDLKT